MGQTVGDSPNPSIAAVMGGAADAIQVLQKARDLAPERAAIEAGLGEAYRAQDWLRRP